jgi:hypothetical protein
MITDHSKNGADHDRGSRLYKDLRLDSWVCNLWSTLMRCLQFTLLLWNNGNIP